MEIAEHGGDPVDPTSTSTGCGECLKYRDKFYYYGEAHHSKAKWIPKDKPAVVMSESNYCGRVRGDRHYLIVAWNGTSFTVLAQAYPGDVKRQMQLFKSMSAKQAIAHAESIEAARQREWDKHPKCVCGKMLMRFEDDQRDDECLTCYQARTCFSGK